MTEGATTPPSSQCPTEFCIYGTTWGMYIFTCARSPQELADRYQRQKGDGTRIIRVVASPWGRMHLHDNKGCIPLTILYRSSKASNARTIIDRSILAGESPVYY